MPTLPTLPTLLPVTIGNAIAGVTVSRPQPQPQPRRRSRTSVGRPLTHAVADTLNPMQLPHPPRYHHVRRPRPCPRPRHGPIEPMRTAASSSPPAPRTSSGNSEKGHLQGQLRHWHCPRALLLTWNRPGLPMWVWCDMAGASWALGSIRGALRVLHSAAAHALPKKTFAAFYYDALQRGTKK